MRKHAGFAVAALVLALGVVVWAKSNVIATNADVIRPSAAISPFELMSNSKNLPVETFEDMV